MQEIEGQMETKWTQEQQQVIDTRDHDLLVSAAAGSGKTAVLVERIIARITDTRQPVDIDRLLIVTFTRAAAAEMRERITAAIDTRRRQERESGQGAGSSLDILLERQQTLIHNAQITTIDSFCLFVVRNHFEDIGLDPNFRIADTGEVQLLEQDVLDEVFERWYAKEDCADFLGLIDAYSGGRNDTAVRDMVARIYKQSGSSPWPAEWIGGLAKVYEAGSPKELSAFGLLQEITSQALLSLTEAKESLLLLRETALRTEGLGKYAATLENDIALFESLGKCRDFPDVQKFLQNFHMGNIAVIRGFDGDEGVKESIKERRNLIKKEIEGLRRRYFAHDIGELYDQMCRVRPFVRTLVELSLDYLLAMERAKRTKRIVDFPDLEHFALRIFVDEQTKEPRPAAGEFADHFDEIMVDEYQDSNQVQEEILRAISGEREGVHKMFMVGDVKQSIYRFRLARPELFMEKYESYGTDPQNPCLRIDLHKNFRSRPEVLAFANDIFFKIMQKDLGNVSYDKASALYEGAVYPESEGMEPEILLYNDRGAEPERDTSSRRMEARIVARKIRQLVDGGFLVRDEASDQGMGLRPVNYRDIVLLLRSFKGWEDDFTEVLEEAGVPVHVERSTGYFNAPEVQVVLCFLQILDNPFQDIPMAAVLRSPIVGLSEEELAQLRVEERSHSFAEAALMAMEEAEEGKLLEFGQLYRSLRSAVRDTPIHELLLRLLRESGYADYVAAMPAGPRRAANLDMLVEKAAAYEKTSYKGLFHFVRYIEQLRRYDVDFGEADAAGENENVVRMMTIHKSKGLEFPVVFVCGCGKRFNQMDTSQKLVLHPDLGLGIWEVSVGEQKGAGVPRPRIKRESILRTAIADRLRRENLGEELRILYVALTRAKEKLILTGSVKDYEKSLSGYTGQTMENVPISYTQRAGAGTYLDWIFPAILSYENRYEPNVFEAEDMVLEEARRQAEGTLAREELLARVQKARDRREEFAGRFSYEYPYQREAGRKSKYSVSELKHDSMLEQYDSTLAQAQKPSFLLDEREPYIPEFAGNEKKERTGRLFDVPPAPPGALRGTAVHRVMECLDFAAIARLDCADCAQVAGFVHRQLEGMLQRNEITEDMYRLVIPSMIESFVKDPVARRMAEAQIRGELYKEKPFVMEYEGVLVQGIIDVFWIEDDRIVVLDYKTDRVETPEELRARYSRQLELYARALGRYFAEGERMADASECLLYAFHLKEVVRV